VGLAVVRRPTLRNVPTPYSRWWHKPLAVLALILMAPLFLAVAVRAVAELANVVVAAVGPVMPYAVVVVVLAVIYRLVLGRRL
jgi:hypothetical protein